MEDIAIAPLWRAVSAKDQCELHRGLMDVRCTATIASTKKRVAAAAGANVVAIPGPIFSLPLASGARKGRKWATSGAVATARPDTAMTSGVPCQGDITIDKGRSPTGCSQENGNHECEGPEQDLLFHSALVLQFIPDNVILRPTFDHPYARNETDATSRN